MAYQKLQGYRAAIVTPSVTVNISTPSSVAVTATIGCVLYIGVAGDLKVTTAGGDDIVFKNVAAGFFPIQVIRVWATGTTGTAATDIIGIW